jgi:anaerobic magnesium-protoporphyrin IX monomethyl ester cyclase
MQESLLDVIVTGEGDLNFPDVVDGKSLSQIPGIYWRKGDEIQHNPQKPLIEYLDDLPMPAWDLYPVEEYRRKFTKILVRNPPLSTIEFSRGCVFKCDFCASKNTMGLGYRKKSPERCADEMEYLEKLGYREALLTDDIFTSNNGWAIAVCEAIIRRKLKIVWTCTNGIRVDSANDELFRAMVRAGCYRVHFGFESGNEQVLKAFGKGGRATLGQGISAVEKARAAGLDTWGMYMVGLSADTESSMQDTIRYAKKTKVDVMKVGITVPFPGTPMFTELHRKGRIKTYNWDDYNVYNEASAIFDHPNLSWSTIKAFYRKAYTQMYYLNPSYILRRVWRGIRTGEFFFDIYYALRFRLFLLSAPEQPKEEQYAYRDSWLPLGRVPSTTATYQVLEAKTTGYRRAQAPSA